MKMSSTELLVAVGPEDVLALYDTLFEYRLSPTGTLPSSKTKEDRWSTDV